MSPRRANNNNGNENENNNNNDTNTAIQQLVAAQAQLMQMMTQLIQANANNNNNNNNNPPPPPSPPPPQVDRLARFLRLRPNKFSSATEPIVPDDWLRSVNKDLTTCECTDAEKVRFTAHLLEGSAAMWWETYQVTHPIDDLDWDTFREGFRTTHISSGTINVKKEEFRSLRQGGRTLKEYMDDFCALSRYAPEDIDIDAKRKEKFLSGLKGELKIPLSVAYAPNYQSLLDQAITLDNNIKKRTVKGSSVTARAMWNHSTRSTIHLRAVDMAALTSMGIVSTKEMVATSTAISIVEVSRETAPVDISVDPMVSIATTPNPRRTSLASLVSSARRMVTIPPAAQKTRPLSLPSPIHFRRAK
jgi:hypothetical protein